MNTKEYESGSPEVRVSPQRMEKSIRAYWCAFVVRSQSSSDVIRESRKPAGT
jgi:hypothetical protein